MKVFNKRDKNIPDDAVYVGRPSIYGNPFVIGRHGDRDAVVRKYRGWINARPHLIHKVKTELRGKDLVCFCAPLACHADVLIEIANES